MFERLSVRRRLLIAAVVLFPLLTGVAVHADEKPKKPTAVPITFVPPPLENATYSVGIYEVKTGKLVRRLCEAAAQGAFTVGLNGLITSWDGKDDDGKTVPPGRYAARGYAVGDLKTEGVAILGNDWSKDDEGLRIKRVEAMAVLPDDLGLAIVAEMASGRSEVACYDGTKGELRWHKPLPVDLSANPPPGGSVHAVAAAGDTIIVKAGNAEHNYRVGDGLQDGSDVTLTADAFERNTGKGGTTWKIEDGVLSQYAKDGERLRHLLAKPGEPVPIAIAPSQFNDRLYLLEETRGWQRLRGLSWVETKKEEGKQISTWQTFFERNIRAPDPSLGLEDVATAKSPVPTVEIALEENPLSPGKPEHAKLIASFDSKGSYLATADGLRLRQISERAHLRAVALVKATTANALTFFQTDGAAWDEFAIKGTKEIISFDAGEFEMSADGEKLSTEKPAEPDL